MAKEKPAAEDSAAEDPKLDTFGQLALPLDGQEFTLRPSFEAITKIEALLGRSLYELAGAATRGSLTLEEMGSIAAEMMRAHGKTLAENDPEGPNYNGAKPEKLAAMIYDEGAPKTCARLMVVLLGALNGGYDATGERKARTAKP